MTTFLEDASTSFPGPMGWGTELDTDKERLTKELQAYDALIDSTDSKFLSRSQPKSVVNNTLMEKVKKLQEQDGIEDGFSFMHLERCIFGEIIPWKAQIIGSCVASGGMYADVGRMLVEAFLVQEPEHLFGDNYVGPNNVAPFAPYNYRAGRKYGNLNGNMDGSFCAEHIKGKLEYGYLMCNAKNLDYQETWLPEPLNGGEYRKWGSNDNLLNKFRPQVKNTLIETEKVNEGSDVLTLLTSHFKPMQICSNYGFAPTGKISGWTFNGQPVYQYRRSGNWAHNMTVYGAVKVKNNWWVIIRNSWGFNAHRNGCWFAVSLGDFESWLKNAECMTIGNIDLPDIQFGNPFPFN